MAKVTSKLQLTIPKAIAVKYAIRPGDDLGWEPAGEVIRLIPPHKGANVDETKTVEECLRNFDQATRRQERRNVAYRRHLKRSKRRPSERGWKREELYTRGREDFEHDRLYGTVRAVDPFH